MPGLSGWQAAASGFLQVTIENTGRGIPPEQLAHLFEAFYQADVNTQKKLRIKGTGLGLAIVKETITRHGAPAVVVVAFRDFQRWRRRRNSLVEFLQKSPLQGVELDLRRDKATPRKVAL